MSQTQRSLLEDHPHILPIVIRLYLLLGVNALWFTVPASIYAFDADARVDHAPWVGQWTTFDTRTSPNDTLVPLADEECCKNPGAIAGCWWKDAERDGVVCLDDSDCSSNTCVTDIEVDGGLPPNGWGLCGCETSSDCADGVCRDGICGPSYCNGFLVCACWGGCDEADVWGYETPSQACRDKAKGFPGRCCEGTYANSFEGVGSGYCSDFCPDPEAPECAENSDCADIITSPLSIDCAEAVCDDGYCEIKYINTNSLCSENAATPDPMPAWHSDCRGFQCTDTGLCELARLSVGTLCDDEDICTLTSTCNADGDCTAATPNGAPEDCCNPEVTSTFDDGNPCTVDSCSDVTEIPPFRDQHERHVDNTACDNDTDRINDLCGVYVCEAGACVEQTTDYIGNDCQLDTWSDCLKYVCSATEGEEGTCVSEARNEGQPCGTWPNMVDTCVQQICEAGSCVYALDVGETGCTPQTGFNACCDYACDGDHECAQASCNTADESLEECEGEDLGTLDENDGSMLTTTATNLCAADDYDVLATGRFSTCDIEDSSDTVHRYTETTHPTEYQLRHTTITLADDGWSPVLYTRSDCEDSSSQQTCDTTGDALTVTSGPWPLVDTPDVESDTDVVTTYTYDNTVIVDARTNADRPGGAYTLDLEVEEHDNDSCINTGDTIRAPHLKGGDFWKKRFRGNVDGYGNFFHENDIDIDSDDYYDNDYCWNGDDPTADDPRFAFFYVDIPETPQGADWNHSYKLYTDPLGTGKMEDVLSFYGTNSDDGDCRSALTSRPVCQNTDSLAPREMAIESDDALRKGFAAVSNADPDEADDEYELNLLRVPKPFLGMSQQFVGPGNGVGCSCNQDVNWTQAFNLIGHRLDFIPTNDAINGFAVRKTPVDNPSEWLVDIENNTDTLVCEGVDCARPSRTTPYDIMFRFPYSGALWSKFCIDAAGRILLANNDECENQWYAMPNSNQFLYGWDEDTDTDADTHALTPSIAPLWGTIVPCNRFEYQGCSWQAVPILWLSVNIYRRTPNDGDVTCEAPMSSELSCLTGCEIWKWNKQSCQSPGRILKELRSFEGTAAMVVTWEGFDGYANPLNGGADHALDFQLILRVDGRITFFYRRPGDPATNEGASDIATIMNLNGWIVGLSGGRGMDLRCESHDECDETLGGSGLTCDLANTSVSAAGKTYDVWTADNRCLNKVNLQSAADVPIPGTWQGE